MLDWITFWGQVMGWIQWLTTLALLSLIAIAGIAYILRDRKWTLDCVIIAVVLVIAAMALAQLGIEILAPAIYDFFRGIFQAFS